MGRIDESTGSQIIIGARRGDAVGTHAGSFNDHFSAGVGDAIQPTISATNKTMMFHFDLRSISCLRGCFCLSQKTIINCLDCLLTRLDEGTIAAERRDWV
jgi:hypothetical protein